jgi:hypothetical protein
METNIRGKNRDHSFFVSLLICCSIPPAVSSFIYLHLALWAGPSKSSFWVPRSGEQTPLFFPCQRSFRPCKHPKNVLDLALT